MKSIPFVLSVVLFVACHRNEVPDPVVPGAVIGGDQFEPSVVTITNNGENLILKMVSGTQSLELITSDTITGRYLIDTLSFKSSVVYQANLVYTDRSTVYEGVSGLLDLEQYSDSYSGTFESVVQSGEGTRIVITDGIFRNVQSNHESLAKDGP